MARHVSARYGIPHLDLDTLAWLSPGVRKQVADSAPEIKTFVDSHLAWVIEGCYTDLLELVLPDATEIHFLNPGTAACVSNCMARPWEPTKHESKEAQDSLLPFLIEWVEQYATRTDEYSLAQHRQLFERFNGRKVEHSQLSDFAS